MQRVPLVATLARIAHDGAVQAVAFSPDGSPRHRERDHRKARLVAVADGRERARITHDNAVNAVAFSPDGRSSPPRATTRRRGWWRWRRPRARPHHPRRRGQCRGVQPGRPVPRHRERRTRRRGWWRWRTAASAPASPTTARSSAVAFSPDGQFLATASTTRRRGLVTVADGRERARITHDVRSTRGVQPGRPVLATASDDKTARLVAVAAAASAPASPTTAGQCGGVQPGRPDPRHREHGQDGAAGGGGGRPRARPRHPRRRGQCAWRSARTARLLATASDDKTARLVAVADSRETRPHHPRRLGRRGGVQPGRPDPRHRERGQDGAAGGGGGRPRARPHHPRRPVHDAWRSARTAGLATASGDRTARLVGRGGRPRAARITHDGPVNAVAFSPDGRPLATASDDKTVRLVGR